MPKSILAIALVVTATLLGVCFGPSGFEIADASRLGEHTFPFSAVEPSLLFDHNTHGTLTGTLLEDPRAISTVAFKRLPPVETFKRLPPVETSDATLADGRLAFHRTPGDDSQPRVLLIPTQWDASAIRRIATYWDARAAFAN